MKGMAGQILEDDQSEQPFRVFRPNESSASGLRLFWFGFCMFFVCFLYGFGMVLVFFWYGFGVFLVWFWYVFCMVLVEERCFFL